MFEQILIKYGMIFAINLIVSIILGKLVSYRPFGPLYFVLVRLFFLGVIVHEICHYIISLAVGIVPKNIKVKFRDEETNHTNPHGYVVTSANVTFLQQFFISIAPLFVSTWLIYISLGVAFYSHFNPLLRILAGFFCISLFLGAAPSKRDFLNIPKMLIINPIFSLYQLFILILSILCSWMLIDRFQLVFDLDIVYFLIIGSIYFGFKFGFKGMRYIFSRLRSLDYKSYHGINYKHYTRRKIRPLKPEKLGIKPTKW